MPHSSTATVRPFAFTNSGYPAMADIHNLVYPHRPITAKTMRHEDESLDATYRWARFVAEQGEHIVGIASYDPSIGSFHPHKFMLSLYVHPDFEGCGIGSALYETLMNALEPLEPIVVRNGCTVTKTMPRSIAFLQKRGFVEERRVWDLWLDVASFDSGPFAGLPEALEGEGIKIVSLAELNVRMSVGSQEGIGGGMDEVHQVPLVRELLTQELRELMVVLND